MTLTVPGWTNASPDWQAVQPGLVVDGRVEIPGGASFRGVRIAGAESRVGYSNLVWTLPDLHIRRPEGEVRAYLQGNERTREVSASVSSTIDPSCLRPLVATNQQEVFNLLSFTDPPRLSVIARGNLKDAKTFQVRGNLAVTNVTFRGEKASGVQTAFHYSNQVIRVIEPRIQRGQENLSADSLV